MSIHRNNPPKPDQRTLNHYFSSYQPPKAFAARQGSQHQLQQPNAVAHVPANNQNEPTAITNNPSRTSSQHGGKVIHSPKNMGSWYSRQAAHSPSKACQTRPTSHSPPLNEDTVANDSPTKTRQTHRIAFKRRQSSSGDSVTFVEDPTPRPTKRARSYEPPSQTVQPAQHVQDNAATMPPSSGISTLTSLKSTPSGISLDRPIYIASSQSDENYEFEQDEGPVVMENESSQHESSSSSEGSRHSAQKTTSDLSRPQFSHHDMSDSDSSLSSLEDLETLLGRGKRRKATEPESNYHNAWKPAADSKFSLASLKKQHDFDVQDNIAMAKARSMFEQAMKEPQAEPKVDRIILGSIVKRNEEDEDDEEAQLDKVMHAMDRTDAMEIRVIWRFFDHVQDITELAVPEFPRLEKQLGKLSQLFRDKSSQQHTFLSGFAQEIFSEATLPDALRDWLWQAALIESDRSLAYAYIQTLKSAMVSNHSALNIIRGFFSSHINARAESLDLESKILPTRERSDAPSHHQLQRLCRVLVVLEQLADCLGLEAKRYSIGVLLRLCVDTEITSDIEIQLALKSSIISLVLAVPDNQEGWSELYQLGNQIMQTLPSPILRNQLISLFPSTTPKTHVFRRHLALSFFLNSAEPLASLLPSSTKLANFPEGILSNLKVSAIYKITPYSAPDYKELSASIATLDVGIDAGFQLFPAASQPKAQSPAAAAAARTNKKQQNPLEAAHNSTVDELSDALRAIFARITDCGAAHMDRTEAKAALERLLNRLEHAVRTRPRPRRTVWDAEVDDWRGFKKGKVGGWRESGAAFMEGFVARDAVPASGAQQADTASGDGESSAKNSGSAETTNNVDAEVVADGDDDDADADDADDDDDND